VQLLLLTARGFFALSAARSQDKRRRQESRRILFGIIRKRRNQYPWYRCRLENICRHTSSLSYEIILVSFFYLSLSSISAYQSAQLYSTSTATFNGLRLFQANFIEAERERECVWVCVCVCDGWEEGKRFRSPSPSLSSTYGIFEAVRIFFWEGRV
jgi:hypothetical protein